MYPSSWPLGRNRKTRGRNRLWLRPRRARHFCQFNNLLAFGEELSARTFPALAFQSVGKSQMIIITLAGNRNTDGSFNNLSSNGNFWTSLQSGTSAWNRNLNSSNATINRNTNSKTNGFSMRCLKNWHLPLKLL